MSRHLPVEETDLFSRITDVSDQIWNLVHPWNAFAKDTIGKQLVRSIDSLGANLVEGDGRYSDAEAIHFFEIARGSGRESKYWLDVAKRRALIPADRSESLIREVDRALQMLNALINYRRKTKNANIVREQPATYSPAYRPERQTPNAESLS